MSLSESISPPIPKPSVGALTIELLTEIFLICVENSDWYRFYAVRVSHVCRHWREVALNTPSLWTNIVVDIRICSYDFTNVAFDRYIFSKQISSYLTRSRSSPLHISINVSLDRYGDAEDLRTAADCIRCVVPMLASHANRWSKFKLTVSDGEHLEFVMAQLERCKAAPLLTHISLEFSQTGVRPPSVWSLNHFYESLPFGGIPSSLTSLVVWGNFLDWKFFIPHTEIDKPLDSPPSAVSMLSHLEFGYFSRMPRRDQFMNILRCSPGLKTLIISDDCQKFIASKDEDASPHDAGRIVLPRLSTLKLVGKSNAIAEVVSTFYAPNLQSLDLEFLPGNESGPSGAVIDMLLMPVQTPLWPTDRAIQAMHVDAGIFILLLWSYSDFNQEKLLHSLERLEHLCLVGDAGARVFEELHKVFMASPTPLCPNLTYLKIFDPDDKLLELVRRRIDQGVPFTRVSITVGAFFRGRLSVDGDKQIKALVPTYDNELDMW